jgi:hypothetical protein
VGHILNVPPKPTDPAPRYDRACPGTERRRPSFLRSPIRAVGPSDNALDFVLRGASRCLLTRALLGPRSLAETVEGAALTIRPLQVLGAAANRRAKAYV